MSFSKKNILLIGLIIVISIVVIGLLVISYWQKNHIPIDAPLDISQEEIKAKCFDNVSKMSDEQIIESINSLSSITDEEIDEIRENAKDYLVCNFRNDREKLSKLMQNILYNKTSILFQQLRLEKVMEILWPVDLPPVSISNILAFESIESICLGNEEKDEFLELCLRTAEDVKNEFSSEEMEGIMNRCKSVCDFFSKYTDNASIFENDYLKKAEWVNNGLLLKKQMFVRVALAFHLGGEELALKICGYVPDLEMQREDCEKYANSLDYIKNCKRFDYGGTRNCIYKECAEIRQAVINLICEL